MAAEKETTHLYRCSYVVSKPAALLQMIGHGAHSEVATQLLTGLPLAYMCGCAYYSLFKLVIFSYYQMVQRATDPVSLLLNAGQVCRFAAPLAYNFMHVIRMNEASHSPRIRTSDLHDFTYFVASVKFFRSTACWLYVKGDSSET